MRVTIAPGYRGHSVISLARRSTTAVALSRETFTTSRLGEFCSQRELDPQTHRPRGVRRAG
jgi:hypothetical protein